MVLSYILISTCLVALISLMGSLTLFFSKKAMIKIVFVLISFAAGTLLGAAFLDLLPEAVEEGGPVFPLALLGIFVFFIMETYLYWYHCHAGHFHEHLHKKEIIKPLGILNLIGDAIHNFTDGIILATAFLVNIPTGIAVSIAIAAHEIPQEIGDYVLLVYSGFSRHKALAVNFLAASTVIVGAVVTYYFSHRISNITGYLIPFSAGGFIYIACTDLMSDLKEEPNIKKGTLQIMMFTLGVGVIWTAINLLSH